MASPAASDAGSSHSLSMTPKGKKKRSPVVEEQMQALVKDLHAAFDTKETLDTSAHDGMAKKREDSQKQKTALVREMRNEKRRTARMKEKTKLLSENDLIEAWSLRYAKSTTKSETGWKKRKSAS